MEHRRRTVSNVIDDDIEKQISRSRGKSASFDEARDNHIEYLYNGISDEEIIRQIRMPLML